MILAGKNEQFAIATEITEATGDGWLFGRFRFVFNNRTCGDCNDEADLKGCYSWLNDFSTTARERYEPELLSMPSSEVFERLVTPVIFQAGKPRMPEFYRDTFARFHISHLGMSAFNSVIMVLIEAPGQQRCVWQAREGGPIYSALFPPRHMQQVAEEFCRLLEAEVAALGYSIDLTRRID